MTNKRTFKMMLLFVAILATFSSCQKDEVSLRTGTLKATFTVGTGVLPGFDYTIYLADNTSTELAGLDASMDQGVLTVKNLNPGNYYLEYRYKVGDTYRSGKVLFQIHSGQTTEISKQI
ncbi:hypothetical protein [Prolixibacter denitrificans]|uniref:Prealbumin-like fold domain-containing protein n=1 Tax=Prolixibacter denitrificans TaxID=1541063 RepID=A0A2P8C6C6_9BACT|nr:hypothetical protein [Prolixibacter denitrificans]PSK80505.1 hypothetical protein CLV93_11535 [Prolixibacter denitrificans]GET22718.1 hypothetical protein JCM18694_29640 [Prolixibacter denitrificans]